MENIKLINQLLIKKKSNECPENNTCDLKILHLSKKYNNFKLKAMKFTELIHLTYLYELFIYKYSYIYKRFESDNNLLYRQSRKYNYIDRIKCRNEQNNL